MNDMDLSNHHVLVTGAAGAIGGAVMQMFARHGATVHGIDVAARDDITACDITDDTQTMAVVADIAARYGLTDVVHAAGAVSVGTVGETGLGEVRRVTEVNLISCFVLARACLALAIMPRSFTVLASQAAGGGSARWAAYSASKAGVVNFVQSWAKEVGPFGMRVNAVCPASVDSPMMDTAMVELAALNGIAVDTQRERYIRDNPLNRMATAQDVAGACLFLASPLASFINGIALYVDGGEGR